MWTVEQKSERLITIAIVSPFGLDDVAAFQAAIVKLLTEAVGRLVTCMDLRGCMVLAPDVADALVALMRRDNPRIERTALILSDNAVQNMQVTRMIREAGNPSRRTFHEATQAATWLEETLSPNEVAILRQHLHL